MNTPSLPFPASGGGKGGGGRLAVDRSVQAEGLARDTAARDPALNACRSTGGWVTLLIDAKNEVAAQWYRNHDAVQLNDAPLSLLPPFAVVAKALKQNNG